MTVDLKQTPVNHPNRHFSKSLFEYHHHNFVMRTESNRNTSSLRKPGEVTRCLTCFPLVTSLLYMYNESKSLFYSVLFCFRFNSHAVVLPLSLPPVDPGHSYPGFSPWMRGCQISIWEKCFCSLADSQHQATHHCLGFPASWKEDKCNKESAHLFVSMSHKVLKHCRQSTAEALGTDTSLLF